MRLTVSHDFLPKRNSVRASEVMDHFGIGFEQGRHVVADGLDVPLQSGDVVLFTGASGSGKSSLLRGTAESLRTAGEQETAADARPRVLDVQSLDLGTRVLIDALPAPVAESMHLLAACGLGEAQLMLRTPDELSDGQRYRFRLALGLSQRPQWLLADEFSATLDRTLARVIACNVRRLADRMGTGFLLATTHEDVAADLAPDVRVCCRLDGEVRVVRRGEHEPDDRQSACEGGVKKKEGRSRSPPNCGSARRPSATGRTSLGGIIGVITSG